VREFQPYAIAHTAQGFTMEMIADAPVTAPNTARTSTPAPATVPQAGGKPGATASVASSNAITQGGEFLTFRLGAEEYGIDILRVQEIRSYEQPTRIANAPAFIKGVVNLRGVIVPIIDLRLKLGCESVEYNTFTVVVVLNVQGRVVGAVVDSVSDVLELSKDQIKPAPHMSSSVDASFITGIGTIGGNEKTTDRNGEKIANSDKSEQRMLILMDIEGLMSSTDMGLINA
jgi:purine-binding chemotaxis protein CheW